MLCLTKYFYILGEESVDKCISEKAMEDLNLIKEVIDRTSNSLISFSRIFIGWGLLLCIAVIFTIIGHYSTSSVFESAVFQLILGILILVIGVMIYIFIARKYSLMGLSRQLMMMWLSVIVFDLLIAIVPAVLSDTLQAPYYDTLPLFLMSFAFGFICTSIFTRLKLPGILAFLYVLLAIYFMQMPALLPYSISFKMDYISAFSVPLGFLILGGYLEIIRTRRS